MITKLLIANRGEIAVRIIRSARSLGIATVAVYSDADAHALHVTLADEAVRLGPAAAAESYLRGEAVIAAARACGADAIHPGYGFLSENPDFADAVVEAGLTFIGPSSSAIRAMGLKDGAKARMEAAGVPVVPGYHGAQQNPELLAQEAAKIGYPVLIKARAGGGGKGMRLVETPDAFAEELAAARREAQNAFGDPDCLIEKYITQPRHIEVQIFGDSHGNVVHLFERDCSLQRRHQKVLEEAPAPGMTDEMRAAMGAAAVRAAQAVDYVGAGTVEFIVDGSSGLRSDGFWFMEMNTRLQVEHPVTEAITGQDLVALQIAVADGAPLPFTQDDLHITGHAVEARLYAEDPANDFLPATGTLSHLRFPQAAPGLRIDTGVEEGDAVTPYYDPMIAKIITHGATRAEALRRLDAALRETEIAGLTTNRLFLARLTADAEVRAGDVDTGLIARKQSVLTHAPAPDAESLALAAIALLRPGTPGANPFSGLPNFRLFCPAQQSTTFAGMPPVTVTLRTFGDGRIEADTPEGKVTLSDAHFDGTTLRYTSGAQQRRVKVLTDGATLHLHLPDAHHAFTQHDPSSNATEAASGTITAPMPGLVVGVAAQAGQTVASGDTLLTLEAMKMEHRLTAPFDGRVAEIAVAQGDQVDQGVVLLELEADG